MIKYLDLQKINASFEPELSDALLRVSHSDGTCMERRRPVLNKNSQPTAIQFIV